ncbi:uncharacterized protein LOC122032461 isoform X2 [Zingiber officinale]|uniref:uncharacterized protein LOC122032461 isoform X2 n=1 Tax=Zingiber officinale TaxID=94328 RepID=UPI001C4CD94D|nr:uncharacterized protein LOC122032461 isoform X2 [Zingiber officinale]
MSSPKLSVGVGLSGGCGCLPVTKGFFGNRKLAILIRFSKRENGVQVDLHTRVAVILNQDAITEMGYGHSFCNDYSKTHKDEKREELFENLKRCDSIGWEVDVIDPWELSAKMLKRKRRFDGGESLWKINMS